MAQRRRRADRHGHGKVSLLFRQTKGARWVDGGMKSLQCELLPARTIKAKETNV
jgi:hypothetical protein